ncbi:tyrosine-type recombinase/integrase [soil metagenome]
MSEKKPKARRDGSISTITEGKKYKLTIYCGRTESGKRTYFRQVFRGTSTQANKRLAKLALDVSNGIMPTKVLPELEVKPAPVLLGETLDRWLKHKSNGRKARPRTIANYEWMLTAYVKPDLGDKPVAEISETDIQKVYSGLQERGIGAKTIRNLHKVLEPALDAAVRWKLLSENPASHVELPVWDRDEARYLTPEQARAFRVVAQHDKWYVAFLLALETGARPNEYLALKWADVDWERSTVRINRSIYWPPGGGFEFTKPKTQKSVRTVSISALAVESLRQHRRIQLEKRMEQGADYYDNGLIFATELGTPLLWRNLGRRHLKPLLTAAGISPEGFSLYSLRHTHCALGIMNGDNVFVIAADMVTSVAMISSTYGHVPREVSQTSSNKLAQLLYGT